MADEKLVNLLKQGTEMWNKWREENPSVDLDLQSADLRNVDLSFVNLDEADLREANFQGANLNYAKLHFAILDSANLEEINLTHADLFCANLPGANLREANLTHAELGGADLEGANLHKAMLMGADLSGANLHRADLTGADLGATDLTNAKLCGAKLNKADLCGATLSEADLSGADLSEVDLTWATLRETILIKTNLEKADLSNCKIYGILGWDIELKDTIQSNLIITPHFMPQVIVDDLHIAQFVYTLIKNSQVRNLIEGIASKAVLIVGYFTDYRQYITDALRHELRSRNYVPIIFNTVEMGTLYFNETLQTLAGMARFVIADISEPHSTHQAINAIVSNYNSVVVQPFIYVETPHAKFKDFQHFPNVLPIHTYRNKEHLMQSLVGKIIMPAEEHVKQLQPPQ